jgi:DNA-binding NarL/FixJ family response regulator
MGAISEGENDLRRVFDQRLRVILLSIESTFRATAPSDALWKRPAAVLRVELSECVYVLTRIPTRPLEGLSRRQREIALLLLEGCSRKSIAQRLGISVRTVDSHRERVWLKSTVASHRPAGAGQGVDSAGRLNET